MDIVFILFKGCVKVLLFIWLLSVLMEYLDDYIKGNVLLILSGIISVILYFGIFFGFKFKTKGVELVFNIVIGVLFLAFLIYDTFYF